jgi:uncharacterized membrane protein HdeD (DUF308 family)
MIRTIAAILLGTLLLLAPKDAIKLVVITIGVLFIIPGLISLISYFSTEKDNRPAIQFLLAGIGCLLFGIVLVAIPQFFVNLLMYVMGAILLLAGLAQIIKLFKTRNRVSVSGAFYIMPVLIIAAGTIVLFNPEKIATAITIIIGISCLIYGLMELVYRFKFRRKNDKIAEIINTENCCTDKSECVTS